MHQTVYLGVGMYTPGATTKAKAPPPGQAQARAGTWQAQARAGTWQRWMERKEQAEVEQLSAFSSGFALQGLQATGAWAQRCARREQAEVAQLAAFGQARQGTPEWSGSAAYTPGKSAQVPI